MVGAEPLSGKHEWGHIVEAVKSKFKGEKFAGFHLMQYPTTMRLDMDIIKNVLIKDFNNSTHRNF